MSSIAAPARSVLIVEDDFIERNGLGKLLRKKGYEVQSAANGQEALELLRSGFEPSLILLDMLMPVLDGWRFLREFQNNGSASTIPIVVMSASVLSREWASDHGCAGFISKPIDPNDLLRAIADWL